MKVFISIVAVVARLHHEKKMESQGFNHLFSNQKHVIRTIHLRYSGKKQIFGVVDEHKRKKSKTDANADNSTKKVKRGSKRK